MRSFSVNGAVECVFVMAYPYQESNKYLRDPVLIALGFHAYVTGSNPVLTPGCEFSSIVQNSTPPRFVNSQLVAFCQFLILLRRFEAVLAYMHGSTSS